jgi:hypothetical protein
MFSSRPMHPLVLFLLLLENPLNVPRSSMDRCITFATRRQGRLCRRPSLFLHLNSQSRYVGLPRIFSPFYPILSSVFTLDFHRPSCFFVLPWPPLPSCHYAPQPPSFVRTLSGLQFPPPALEWPPPPACGDCMLPGTLAGQIPSVNLAWTWVAP